MSYPALPDEAPFVFGVYATHLVTTPAAEQVEAHPAEAPAPVGSDDPAALLSQLRPGVAQS